MNLPFRMRWGHWSPRVWGPSLLKRGADHPDVIVLSIVALIPQLLLGTSVYTDSTAPLEFNPVELWNRLSFVWDQKLYLGSNQGWGQAYLFPIGAYFATGSVLGVPMWLLQRLWLFGILFAAGYGARCLARQAWSSRAGRAGGLASGLVYMLSPFTFLYLTNGSAVLLPYALLPTILLITIRLVRDGLSLKRFAGLVFLSCLQAFIQPAFAALNLLVVFGYLLFDAVLPRPSLKRLRSNGALAGAYAVSVVGLNLWWLLPTSIFLQSHGVTAYISAENPLTLNTSSSYLEILRMLGNSGFYGFYSTGVPYIAYSPLYVGHPVWIAASFAIPMIAVLGLAVVFTEGAWMDIRTRVALFFAVLVALGIPLAVGAYPPTNPSPSGAVYLFLFNNVPGFQIFKQSNVFVTLIALGYAYFVGQFVTWLWLPCSDPKSDTKPSSSQQRLRFHLPRTARAAITVVIVLLIVVNGWPVVSGAVVPQASRFTSVPQYWYDAGSWLNRQPGDFRVLLTPYQYFPRYSWSQMPGPVEPSLIRASVIEPLGGVASFNAGGQTIVNSIYDTVQKNRTAALPNLLNAVNAEFILQRNDALWQLDGSPAPGSMQALLNRSTTYQGAFGALDIYRNPSWAPAFIFAPNWVTGYNGNPQSLVTTLGGGQLAQLDASGQSWSADLLSYQLGLENFSISTNATILSGDAVGLAWTNGTSQITAYLGTGRSGLNVTGSAGDLPIAFNATANQAYHVAFSRSANRLLFSVDGSVVLNVSAPAMPRGNVGLSTRNASVQFDDVRITNLDGESTAEYLNVSNLPYGPFQEPGWAQSGGDWEIVTSNHPPDARRSFPYTAFIGCQDLANATVPMTCAGSNPSPTRSLTPPTVGYSWLSPTTITVHLGASATAFLLVMSQSFDGLWRLRLGAQEVPPVLVDAYAMAWWIQPGNATDLVLSYPPQLAFDVGVAASTGGLAVFAAVFVVTKNRVRNKRGRNPPRSLKLAHAPASITPRDEGEGPRP